MSNQKKRKNDYTSSDDEDEKVPLKKKRGPKAKKVAKLDDVERVTVRQTVIFPTSLSNPDRVHALDRSTEEFATNRQRALDKAKLVWNGEFQFGMPIVLTTFLESNPGFVLDLTIQAIFIMYALCSEEAVRTTTGQVSIWPMTVYKSEEKRAAFKEGFPVLAIHRAHFRCLIFRMMSSAHKPFKINHFDEHLPGVKCHYDTAEDASILEVTGLDRYKCARQNETNSFFLIPAHWFDVMSTWFRGKSAMDIMDSAFRDLRMDDGAETYGWRLDPEFKALWTGDGVAFGHKVQVFDILAHLEDNMCHSMTRSRPVDRMIRCGDVLWELKAPVGRPIEYQEDCFSYGVQCWLQQLVYLNQAFVFFHPQGLWSTEVHHMNGLFGKNPTAPVLSKEQCIANGIVNSSRRRPTSLECRKLRYLNKKALQTVDGPFFGLKSVRRYRVDVLARHAATEV